MKFLPQRYREAQTDWFGKRGISWHISVVVRRVDWQLQTQTFVHILQSSNQGSATVVRLLEHVLRTLKTDHPEIQYACLRQDNDGCYHGATTILAVPAVQSSSGVSVLAMDFPDPQGIKGPADRISATCKNHIRRFINEGHDVTRAQEVKDAILSHGGIEGVRVAVVETTIQEAPDKRKLHGINKLNNFEFRDDGCVLARRAYGIGEGSIINLTGDKREGEYTLSRHGLFLEQSISVQDRFGTLETNTFYLSAPVTMRKTLNTVNALISRHRRNRNHTVRFRDRYSR